jgi:beta-lactamase regulating signal transducer with metallopeptidase domain
MTRLLEIGMANALFATLLAPVALLVGRLSRRPALGHCLWILVLLRLVAPPVVGIPGISLEAPKLTGARAHPSQPPLIKGGNRKALVLVQAVMAASAPAAPRDKEGLGGVRALGPEDILRPLAFLWLTGSACWFVVAGLRIARFRHLLTHAEPAPSKLQAEAARLAERLGLARCPTISIVPFAVSPLVWGLVGGRAWLVLPADLLAHLNPDEQSALLAHELAHLRRRDHWVRWLEIAALGLYWWHPVAWWARREIARAEEQCCDAWVVWSLPGAAVAYAKALLKTVDFLSEARPALPLAASGAGHVRSLKRRIAMILRTLPLSPHLSWPARAGALMLGLLVLPFGPQPSLRAQSAPDKPAAPSPPAKELDRETRNLERRLQRLEKQLDKLTSRLERDLQAPKPKPEAKPDAPSPAPKPKPEAKPRAERDEDEEMDERAEEIASKIEEWVEKFIDPERLEAMGKKIEEAVKKGIDPEKLEAMGKKLEEAMKDGVDAEHLGNIGEEIAKALKEGLDADRLSEMGEEISKALKEGFAPQDGQGKNKAPKPKAKPAPPHELDRESRDLDRRMQELERKLDRLMERLDRGNAVE